MRELRSAGVTLALILPQPNDVVFTTPKTGGSMDHYFSQKVRKKVLAQCGVSLKPPYSIRHSAISHTLDRTSLTLSWG